MLRIRDYHPLWLFFPEHSSHNLSTTAWSYNPRSALLRHRFGLFPVRSPLLGESLVYFLFLEVLRCFSSLRSPHYLIVITGLQPAGLSHSEILGSKVICTYPRLIAAYHVLHRLREPRHPPCAFLTFFAFFVITYKECSSYFQLLCDSKLFWSLIFKLEY